MNQSLILKLFRPINACQCLRHATSRCLLIKGVSARCFASESAQIQDAIYSASSPREIADIFHFKMNDIHHSSIYGKAMKQMASLRSRDPDETVKQIKSVMDILLHQHDISVLSIESVIEFNIFFQAMIKFDKPDLCQSYFDEMVNHYKLQLTPNSYVFASMIKSCRSQGNYQQAEWYWDIMTKKYNLIPNTVICTEMMSVYYKAHQKEKAITFFNKYGSEIADKQMMSSYLSVFTRTGDVNGMQNVLEMMRAKGFQFDSAIFADVMTGYFNAKQPQRCLEVFDELISSGICYPNREVLGLKCLALCYMLQTDRSLSSDRKQEIYAEIKDVIERKYPFYGIVCQHQEYELLLRATILLNEGGDQTPSIKVLEGMLKRKQLFIADRSGAIDLHRYFPITAVFILRYVLFHKLDTVLQRNMDSLSIIVGKGKHRSGAENRKGNLKRLIVKELMSFDPPIQCHNHPTNEGMIVIDRQYLEHLVETNKRRSELK